MPYETSKEFQAYGSKVVDKIGNAAETRLCVQGYCSSFFISNTHEVIGVDSRAGNSCTEIDLYHTGTHWKKPIKDSVFRLHEKKAKAYYGASNVIHRANGDYIFVDDANSIIRMDKTGTKKSFAPSPANSLYADLVMEQPPMSNSASQLSRWTGTRENICTVCPPIP